MVTVARQAGGRLAERDALLIMMAYRHGFRANRVALDQIYLKAGTLHVARFKHGSPSTHPLAARSFELYVPGSASRAPRRHTCSCHFVVAQMTRRTAHHVVAEAAKAAGIEFPVHPHMLRHATGFSPANAGQDTRAIQLHLGHKNIQHIVRYMELESGRFKDFWKD
jgi:type 1 fimbriae regulatory protein FimB/type 1 fimbriae regulatory protein FimE